MANKKAIIGFIFFCAVSAVLNSPIAHALIPPSALTLSPSSGSSNSDELVTYTATFTDSGGWGNISRATFQTGDMPVPNRILGILYVQQNALAVESGFAGGQCTPGSAVIIDTPNFYLDCSQIVLLKQDNTLTLTYTIRYKEPFVGTKNLYLSMKQRNHGCSCDEDFEEGDTTGLVDMGDWTINDGTPPVTTANPPAGTFTGSTDITLSANEPATIYFTTDGSEPNTSSQTYSTPIHLTETATLKFFAVDTTNNSEAVKTEVYTRIGGPTYIPGGQIIEDTVWTLFNSPYIIQGGVSFGSISGPPVTLTIEPGVEVRFDAFTQLNIGNVGAATLSAQGTPQLPIRFTSNQSTPAPGDWEGIVFSTYALPGTIFNNCIIEYAGPSNVRVDGGFVAIKNSVIRFSSGEGIKINSSNIFLEVHQSTFVGNALGGIDHIGGNRVQAQLNWWGDASGPSGAGPGMGASISDSVDFDPWLATPSTNPFQWSSVSASPREFKQTDNSAMFQAKSTEAMNWSIDILNPAMSQVFKTFGGSGSVIQSNWAGDDNSSIPLPDGEYRFRLSGTNIGSGLPIASAAGVVKLNGLIPVAKITQPVLDQFLQGFTTVSVTGTAADSDFRDYKLERFNTFTGSPVVELASGSTSVENGTLANWDIANLPDGFTTLRLTVTDEQDHVAIAEVPVRIFNIASSAHSESFISPNGDSLKDSTLISATSTFPADWSFEIKNQANQAIRTHQLSGQTSFAFVWDGKDQSSAIVPDGLYTYHFAIADQSAGFSIPSQPGSSPVVVDDTPPTAIISNPTSGQEIFGFSYDVVGTADDTNFESFELSHDVLGSFSPFSAGIVNIVDATLGTWPDLDTIQNGNYHIELKVTDKAANTSTLVVPVVTDNMEISNVSRNPEVIDHKRGETTGISYTLDQEAQVSIKIYDELTQSLVRTLVDNQLRMVGPHSETWDGKDDANQELPYEAYYFDIVSLASDGRADRFSDFLTGGVVPGAEAVTTQNVNFSSYKNEALSIQYTLPNFQRQPIWIAQQLTGNIVRTLVGNEPRPGGPKTDIWDGRDDAGAIFTGDYFIIFFVPTLFHSQTILLRDSFFESPVSNLKADAYLILPAHSEVSTIKYDLNVSADVSVAIQDPNGNHFRTLLQNQTQTPGQQTLTWDGTNDNGEYASVEGGYTVEITAVDPSSGSIREQRGSVTVYR